MPGDASWEPFDAVSLDVGGVVVVPDHGMIAVALTKAGVTFDRDAFGPAHYYAMHEVDSRMSLAEDFSDYQHRFLVDVGVPDDLVERGAAALDAIFETPLWCQPVPGSRAAMHALLAAGLRLAVTSNSDGTVADLLLRHEVCQVGDGPGVPLEWISDSGVVGHAKPDPRLFAATAEALGLPAARVLHVGDSVHYDVEGARAAGLQGVHFDPFTLCTARDAHPHVRSLTDFL
jgi:putative hydrolase of the HAD superfamily